MDSDTKHIDIVPRKLGHNKLQVQIQNLEEELKTKSDIIQEKEEHTSSLLITVQNLQQQQQESFLEKTKLEESLDNSKQKIMELEQIHSESENSIHIDNLKDKVERISLEKTQITTEKENVQHHNSFMEEKYNDLKKRYHELQNSYNLVSSSVNEMSDKITNQQHEIELKDNSITTLNSKIESITVQLMEYRSNNTILKGTIGEKDIYIKQNTILPKSLDLNSTLQRESAPEATRVIVANIPLQKTQRSMKVSSRR